MTTPEEKPSDDATTEKLPGKQQTRPRIAEEWDPVFGRPPSFDDALHQDPYSS